ncbi:hypothetical protein [Neorhizobium galegae]|uniref:hypothetical protein n=1 Tax=Neorhizobium galegae TaxID=399 RepID=UPI001F24AA4E|nr:hypothetical protein [Neorhizobium galegae]UIK04822.1 hypothetical protein LZK81_19495 [Neorhizobium galegae]
MRKRYLAPAWGVSLAVLASCGDGPPTPGETITVPFAALSVPAPEKRQVPLYIINGQLGSGPADSPQKLADYLKADQFTVTLKPTRGREFEAITGNKINKVVVPDYETVELTAKRDQYGRDTGITGTITARYVNGFLKEGTWTVRTWFNPPPPSPVPSGFSPKMEISPQWVNGILNKYNFPPVKGEKAQGGLGTMTRAFRKEDTGQACFSPAGAPIDIQCATGIGISYTAAYELQDNRNEICWQGVCKLDLRYRDHGLNQFEDDLRTAMVKAYREKFGEIDPTRR